jgi:aerobic-type carbon monoxide dehydrogenase small subunit (CoxS/CutS family)
MADYVLHVNGAPMRVEAPPDEPLLSVLRYRLDLTGTKYGCGEGKCGACTVLLNGEAFRSCQVSVGAAANADITTIEGLERHGVLTPVQQAFVDEDALQCGYCTSGMIVTATALLHDNPHPTDEQITKRMDGNVCRCGSYPRIVAAVRRAAAQGGRA